MHGEADRAEGVFLTALEAEPETPDLLRNYAVLLAVCLVSQFVRVFK
jgi:hypothetical protein